MPQVGVVIPETPPSTPTERERYREWYTTYVLLSTTLQLAVPLWIEELRGRRWEYIEKRARICCDMIAEHGDNLLFRGKKKGTSAEAFNRLAEGVACLSFAPGGVNLFGDHWEACLDEQVDGRAGAVLGSLCQAIQGFFARGK